MHGCQVIVNTYELDNSWFMYGFRSGGGQVPLSFCYHHRAGQDATLCRHLTERDHQGESELASALTLSENCDRVSETGETGLADVLTNKENYTKKTIKKEKESALPGEVDQKQYDDRGRELNEAV